MRTDWSAIRSPLVSRSTITNSGLPSALTVPLGATSQVTLSVFDEPVSLASWRFSILGVAMATSVNEKLAQAPLVVPIG